MKDRTKEIKYLMYLKSQIIKEQKKEMHNLKIELETIERQKTKKRKRYNGGI